MTLSRRGFRGAVSAVLAGLFVALSVATPLIERADVGHRTVLESHHDAGRCGAHDHSLCTLLSAHHSAPGAARVALVASATTADDAAPVSRDFWHAAFAADHPARAPPAV